MQEYIDKMHVNLDEICIFAVPNINYTGSILWTNKIHSKGAPKGLSGDVLAGAQWGWQVWSFDGIEALHVFIFDLCLPQRAFEYKLHGH